MLHRNRTCLLAGLTVLILWGALAPPVDAQSARRAQASSADASTRYEGTVALMNRRGTRPARSVSARDVLVVFTPDAKSPDASKNRSRSTPEMVMLNKAYQPRVLAVPKGQPVRFPNRDKILHNVFSVSGDNAFDLGLYGGGKSDSKAFEEPGLVRIFCNVHRDMVGFVWVLDTPYFVRPGADGRFAFEGLPEGPGTLTLWHERSEPLEIDVTVGRDWQRAFRQPVELRITRPRVPSHSRKDGSNYRKRESYRGGAGEVE